MIKIALSGWMYSGKTTVAEYLNEHYGFDTFSFADALKLNLEMIGIEPDRLYREKDATVRTLMQVYGQAMRQQDEDYWAKMILESVDTAQEYGSEAVVIDDMRFQNEFWKLRSKGFILVRVVNDTLSQINFDISETDLNDLALDGEFDYTLCARDGDLRHLFQQVDDMMRSIQG